MPNFQGDNGLVAFNEKYDAVVPDSQPAATLKAVLKWFAKRNRIATEFVFNRLC